jgi:hypothetical protein
MGPDIFERKLSQIEESFDLQVLLDRVAQLAAEASELRDLDGPEKK